MRHTLWIGAALAALTVTSAAVAQGATAKQPAYDAKHEVEVRGKVLTIKAMPDWMGKDGVNLSVETSEAVARHIDVAPASFLSLLEFPIEAGGLRDADRQLERDRRRLTGLPGARNPEEERDGERARPRGEAGLVIRGVVDEV